MGTDIWSDKAFVLTLSDLFSLIEPEHLLGIRQDVAELFYKKLGDADIDEALKGALSSFKNAISSHHIVNSIISMFENEDFEDDGASIDAYDQRFILVSILCEILLPVTPKEIRIFTRPRIEGYEVPTGELVLILTMIHALKYA